VIEDESGNVPRDSLLNDARDRRPWRQSPGLKPHPAGGCGGCGSARQDPEAHDRDKQDLRDQEYQSAAPRALNLSASRVVGQDAIVHDKWLPKTPTSSGIGLFWHGPQTRKKATIRKGVTTE